MGADAIDALARSLLYEGYLLYPYSATALKNRCRWTFGAVFPREYDAGSELSRIGTQCLVAADRSSSVSVVARFLHLTAVDGRQEAAEREVRAGPFGLGASIHAFCIPASGSEGRDFEPLSGELEVRVEELQPGLLSVDVSFSNTSPLEAGAPRAAAELRSMASTHLILSVDRGRFVSLADPPPGWAEIAKARVHVGLWPALVGSGDTVLAAPIILEDFVRLAPESPGDLFDSTEIDEILTLRVLTLTDSEKAEMRSADPRAAELLERVETLGADGLARLHGALRRSPIPPAAGDRVRLRPSRRADIFDLALAGKLATVESVLVDADGALHVAVTLDDDPGRDLGLEGQPGHRFFFAADEVELAEEARP